MTYGTATIYTRFSILRVYFNLNPNYRYLYCTYSGGYDHLVQQAVRRTSGSTVGLLLGFSDAEYCTIRTTVRTLTRSKYPMVDWTIICTPSIGLRGRCERGLTQSQQWGFVE